jgi:hypothetical protein
MADTSLFAYMTILLNFTIQCITYGLKEVDKSEEEIAFTLANI